MECCTTNWFSIRPIYSNYWIGLAGRSCFQNFAAIFTQYFVNLSYLHYCFVYLESYFRFASFDACDLLLWCMGYRFCWPATSYFDFPWQFNCFIENLYFGRPVYYHCGILKNRSSFFPYYYLIPLKTSLFFIYEIKKNQIK